MQRTTCSIFSTLIHCHFLIGKDKERGYNTSQGRRKRRRGRGGGGREGEEEEEKGEENGEEEEEGEVIGRGLHSKIEVDRIWLIQSELIHSVAFTLALYILRYPYPCSMGSVLNYTQLIQPSKRRRQLLLNLSSFL